MDPIAFAVARRARDAWKHPPSRAVLRELGYAVRPVGMAVIGDSTGNGTGEWPYLLAQELGERFPAYSVTHRLYDETVESWGAATLIQTGSDGAAYFEAGTTDARNFSVSDNTLISVTGDMSVRVKLSKADWDAGSTIEAFNKFGGGGNRSWRFQMQSDGTPALYHTSDGTTEKAAGASEVVPFVDGGVGWIRADLDVDNGAAGHDVTFYTSPDGSTWTQLGTTQTTAGTTSVFDSTASLLICNRGATNVGGDFYAAELYSGLGASSELVAAWSAGEMRYEPDQSGVQLRGYDCRGNRWVANSAGVTQGITGSPAIHMVNASLSGYSISGFEGQSRMDQILGQESMLAFINLGHNGQPAGGSTSYRHRLNALADEVTTAWPECGVVFTTQNPRTGGGIADHEIAMADTAVAASVGGHGLADAYAALSVDTGTYVSGDGIHPTAAGSALWKDVLYRFLLSS